MASGASRDEVPVTSSGLAELQAELERLEGPARREIAERIKTAREWGDLSENSEYHDAKNDQAHLETKIARLRERISRAVIVDETGRTATVVGFGATVKVVDDQGDEHEWRLVASHDAAPARGLLSIESPVARALSGLMAGDEAAIDLPGGTRRLRVIAVG
jgi:transcription elongation factor GreA